MKDEVPWTDEDELIPIQDLVSDRQYKPVLILCRKDLQKGVVEASKTAIAIYLEEVSEAAGPSRLLSLCTKSFTERMQREVNREIRKVFLKSGVCSLLK